MPTPKEDLEKLSEDARKSGVDLFASVRGEFLEISSCSLIEGAPQQIDYKIAMVLGSLCKLADTHKLYLTVTPGPFPGERNSKNKLADYYKGFGFQKNFTSRIARFETQHSYIRSPR